MQIALGATLLLLVVWFLALRPKSPAAEEAAAPAPAPAQTAPAPAGGAAPGPTGLTGAIDKAHDAVTTADGDAARAAQTGADDPAPAATGGGADAAARPARSSAGAGARASTRAIHARGPVASVRTALKLHKAVAVAFVDSATADSQAVERELLHVSRFDGRAFTIAVSLADLSDYAFITKTVEVTVAPTVVVVDPRRRATTIVGATDRGEIEQRLADALAARRGKR
jgi:hypothetical protein